MFKEAVVSVAISNDTRYIASGDRGGCIKVYDINEEKEHYSVQDAHSGNTPCIL